jgi:hypothetical protein
MGSGRQACQTVRVAKKGVFSEEDTSTPIIGKIVSRLEMDSRWALARSVRALVAERDGLKEKLERNSSRQKGPAPAEGRNFYAC